MNRSWLLWLGTPTLIVSSLVLGMSSNSWKPKNEELLPLPKVVTIDKQIEKTVLCNLYPMPQSLSTPDIDIFTKDKQILTTYKQSLFNYDDNLKSLSSLADTAIEKDSKIIAECVLSNIASWAHNNVFLGEMKTTQSQYEKGKFFVSVSLIYYKIRKYNNEAFSKEIDVWLRTLARDSYVFLTEKAKKTDSYYYWMGLGFAATSLSTKQDDLWSYAKTAMEIAANNIQEDGTLISEIKKNKPMFYHLFAVSTLVPLAEFGRLKGEDWYALNNGALHRLVDLCIFGLKYPTTFRKVVMNSTEEIPYPGAGWLDLYKAKYNVPVNVPTVESSYFWLGGDVRNLFK